MSSFFYLFSISIKDEFYKNLYFTNFDIIPDKKTLEIFKRFKITYKKLGYKYDFIWLIKNKNNIEKCFINNFKDSILKFSLLFKSNDIYKNSEIDFNSLYEFKNSDNSLCLHSNTFVDDSSSKKNIFTNKIFANVEINMNLLKNNEKNDFFIHLKPIESLWRIYFVNKEDTITIKSFNLDNKNIEFTNKNNIYTSKNKITLKEKRDYDFFIEYYEKKNNITTLKKFNIIPPIFYNFIENGNYVSNIEIDLSK